MEGIEFQLVWFDSLGAKSSCTLVKTDTSILIDPGAAIMQPSFPAPLVKKIYWLEKAGSVIRRVNEEAKITIITHYHYDHFMEEPGFYGGKILLAKSPNEYINDSQRRRAEHFFDSLFRRFKGKELEGVMEVKGEKDYPNPLDELPEARSKDFGDYGRRREELLAKGLKWFMNRAKNWNSRKKIPELRSKGLRVEFADGKKFKFGRTRIRLTKPLFHGIEFSRVGWVFSVVIEYGKEKLIHSSDLNGPIIEDYASWIIEENPDVLILDGPMTYMFGYLLNRTNLNRAVENVCRMINETDTRVIIFDHHLPREPKFKERLARVYELARKTGKKVMTAAEYLGKRPKVLEC